MNSGFSGVCVCAVVGRWIDAAVVRSDQKDSRSGRQAQSGKLEEASDLDEFDPNLDEMSEHEDGFGTADEKMEVRHREAC